MHPHADRVREALLDFAGSIGSSRQLNALWARMEFCLILEFRRDPDQIDAPQRVSGAGDTSRQACGARSGSAGSPRKFLRRQSPAST